jgi:dihydropteroate synthase
VSGVSAAGAGSFLLLPGGRKLDLDGPALVMAIVNCTPDSFYAPSRADAADAVERALRAEAAGAAIVDLGGGTGFILQHHSSLQVFLYHYLL